MNSDETPGFIATTHYGLAATGLDYSKPFEVIKTSMERELVEYPKSITDVRVADTAILAIMLLRYKKLPGQKKVGPNRDDLPVLTEITDAWLHGSPVNKDKLFSARARVVKYAKQISLSHFGDDVFGSSAAGVRKYQDYSLVYQKLLDELRLVRPDPNAVKSEDVKNMESNYGIW